MRLLLDTHVFFWFMTESMLLKEQHKLMIDDQSHSIFVSAVTAWEMATKVKLDKWAGAEGLLPDLTASVLHAGMVPLDLTMRQAEMAGSLPLVHRDPFDRMLVAQSLDLDMPVLTVDPALARLGCKTL